MAGLGATGSAEPNKPPFKVRILAGCSGVAAVALVAFALVFVGSPSRSAFTVAGGGLQAHDCPGGPVVDTIPPTDVVVVTGWRYQGRFGHWSAVTWDDSRSATPITRLVWVADDDLVAALGGSALRSNGNLTTDPAFDTCTPQPSVLATVETAAPDTEARSAVVTDQPDTTVAQTSVAAPDTRSSVTTAKRAASPTQPKPTVATTPTTASTTSSSTTTTAKPTTTTTTSTTTTVPQITMPDVLNLSHQDAQQKLTDLGLHVTSLIVPLPKGDTRDGLVVSQLPTAGTPVDPDTNVFIGIGQAPKVAVPDVVGLYWEDAQTILYDAGLDVQVVNDPQVSTDGNVLSQDPAAGTQVIDGTTVTIKVNDCCAG